MDQIQRREAKKLRPKYRQAAARLYRTSVPETSHVQPMHDGAWVEIVVWIPKTEAEKEP